MQVTTQHWGWQQFGFLQGSDGQQTGAQHCGSQHWGNLHGSAVVHEGLQTFFDAQPPHEHKVTFLHARGNRLGPLGHGSSHGGQFDLHFVSGQIDLHGVRSLHLGSGQINLHGWDSLHFGSGQHVSGSGSQRAVHLISQSPWLFSMTHFDLILIIRSLVSMLAQGGT